MPTHEQARIVPVTTTDFQLIEFDTGSSLVSLSRITATITDPRAIFHLKNTRKPCSVCMYAQHGRVVVCRKENINQSPVLSSSNLKPGA